ncbi:hypothetical protein ACU5JM_09550 [Rhodococcus erythropolis]|uniref:hypothetical protein n=1 Tax=Rhodococcus erythropolis TaxID=1833 RepID=UPI00406BCBE9
MSANRIEALAKALYENGNPQHTAEDRAMLGPFEELDVLQQTIWIDLANAAQHHMDKRIEELEAGVEHWKDRSQYNYDCGMVLANEANARAEKAEATIARVEAELDQRYMDGTVEVQFIHEALKGE